MSSDFLTLRWKIKSTQIEELAAVKQFLFNCEYVRKKRKDKTNQTELHENDKNK